jgi:1-deoxy-D-xylulose-5-phosphate reductoisomerase
MNQKRIAIFGSTGSIGKQTLEVISAHPDLFVAEILTAHSNESLLIEQALLFVPNIVVIGDITKYTTVKKALESEPSYFEFASNSIKKNRQIVK